MIEHTEQFFVCKFKDPNRSSNPHKPWAGMDEMSGGYPYGAGAYYLDSRVHRWPPTQRAEVFKYCASDLDVYLVTVSYRNKPGEGSYSVKSDAVLAWPPNKK